MVNWTDVRKGLTILHISKVAITLHCFCTPAFLKSRLNQHWRSAFFHSSFCNYICFGSVRSRALTIPIQPFARMKKQTIVRTNGSLVFFWTYQFSKNAFAPPELIWFCMGNIEFGAANSCTTTAAYLWCILDSCSSLRTLWSAVIMSPSLSATLILFARSSEFLAHGALVTFEPLHTLQFVSFGKWVNKVCLLLCSNYFVWRMRGSRKCWRWYFHVNWRRLSNLTTPLFNPSVNGWYFCFYALVVVAHCWCSLPELWSDVRLLARLEHAKECGVCITLDFSRVLDEICWLAWMPFMRVPRVILSTIELEQTCRNRQHFLLLLLSYGSYLLQSKLSDRTLIFESFLAPLESNHFYTFRKALESTTDSLSFEFLRGAEETLLGTWSDPELLTVSRSLKSLEPLRQFILSLQFLNSNR